MQPSSVISFLQSRVDFEWVVLESIYNILIWLYLSSVCICCTWRIAAKEGNTDQFYFCDHGDVKDGDYWAVASFCMFFYDYSKKFNSIHNTEINFMGSYVRGIPLPTDSNPHFFEYLKIRHKKHFISGSMKREKTSTSVHACLLTSGSTKYTQ